MSDQVDTTYSNKYTVEFFVYRMKIAFEHVYGTPALPRKGEKIIIHGKVWEVRDVIHDLKNCTIKIYVVGYSVSEITDWWTEK